MTISTQGEDLEKRDAIARIVDPEAWEECFPLEGDPDPVGAEIFGDAITESLSKADAILSMISASPSREEGGSSCTDRSSPQMATPTQSPFVWRDISSAPRDGTHILATKAGGGDLGHLGPLNPHGFRDKADWCDVVHWFNDPDEPGFYSTSWGGDQEHPFDGLTHWQSLPNAPAKPDPLARCGRCGARHIEHDRELVGYTCPDREGVFAPSSEAPPGDHGLSVADSGGSPPAAAKSDGPRGLGGEG